MVKAVPQKSPLGIFYNVYINEELEMTGATKKEAKEIYECYLHKKYGQHFIDKYNSLGLKKENNKCFVLALTEELKLRIVNEVEIINGMFYDKDLDMFARNRKELYMLTIRKGFNLE
ncbi:hypothetical protein [Caminibacter sp.]